MEQPVNDWKPYVPICLEELHTDTIYKNEYSIYIVSRDKRKYWEIITEMYQYMRKLYEKITQDMKDDYKQSFTMRKLPIS